jgi:hypothetical protein
LNLSRHWGHTETEVGEALQVLQRLEGGQLVRVRQMQADRTFRAPIAADHERAKREYGLWLPRATASEAIVDEVGF